ncbi:hypothetical protein [Chryseobacterium wanjuense]|nr:hypothetical protein [Chryseobacterium wanjuense]
MLDLILMLIALAFGNNNANTSCNNDNNGQVTTQLADPGGSTDPGTGTGEDGGPVGGNTGQTPPPFTNP